jgi:ribosomal protein L25 (general stress protein Ctc)
MNSKPYFQIRPDGTVNVLPAPPKTVSVDHAKRPVNFAVRRAPLGLEIHGENFSTVIDLTVDDALSIIMLLTYAAREAVYTPTKSQFPEVAQ